MQISLKAARVNAKMTQRAVADAIGVDVSTVASWENGKTAPKAPQLDSLCRLYDIPIDNIFLREKSSLTGLQKAH